VRPQGGSDHEYEDPQVLISHGAMTDARWKSFYETMAGAGVLTQGVDPRSLEFVNKGIGA
jgi:hypothetical protein